jgi:hypothetical protein
MLCADLRDCAGYADKALVLSILAPQVYYQGEHPSLTNTGAPLRDGKSLQSVVVDDVVRVLTCTCLSLFSHKFIRRLSN